MNDALRLLRKVLRSCGYDIKERYRYNLLPTNNQEKHPQLERLYHAAETTGEEKNRATFKQLHICLRTCLRADNRKAQEQRLTGTDHREIVVRCIHSLVKSINHAVAHNPDLVLNFIILDDHSDTPGRNSLECLQKKAKCDASIITTKARGQGESLLQQFKYARERDGLFYFCEDDYLHEKTAINEMVHFYRHVYDMFDTHLVLHPQEHEFLYIRSLYPSYLLQGENRHWRTISHATHVLFMHSDLVKKYWDYFSNTRYVGDRSRRRKGVESRTTNRLFEHVPGFAPLPALAAHMQTERTLPPFFDWRPLWEENRLD